MIKISSSVLCSKVFIQVCNTTCFHYIYEQIPDVSLCMVYVMLFMWSHNLGSKQNFQIWIQYFQALLIQKIWTTSIHA